VTLGPSMWLYAVRLIPSSGNITSGIVRLYGLGV
jgi:hypothetical protein